MNKISEKQKQTLINQYGKCIYNGVIDNSDKEHKFICKDKDIKKDYLKLYLNCKDCDFMYSLIADYNIEDAVFLTILNYGIYDFSNTDLYYEIITERANNSLYQNCKNAYKQITINN